MVKFILLTLIISSNVLAQSEALVDPTKPLNFQVNKEIKVYQASLPNLQSIVVKFGKSQAIINNQLYQQGQSVSGYKIILIDTEKVLLTYKNKTYKLTLYSSDELFID